MGAERSTSAYITELEDVNVRAHAALTLAQKLRAELAGFGYVVVDVDVVADRLDTIIAAFQGDK